MALFTDCGTDRGKLEEYMRGPDKKPQFVAGDSLEVLQCLPADSIDFCMTSPPYWGKRTYENGGIGQEKHWRYFVEDLAAISAEVKRVLKPTGSYWLNMGDTFLSKQLLGIPWRVTFELTDNQGWMLRNSVIWNKLKGGPDNSKDRLRNVHENVFHFVKDLKGYYFNADAIRSAPQKTKIKNGAIISATGVSGVRYKRQIELSTSLTEEEKKNAFLALSDMLDSVKRGKYSDFRMIIRGQQRTTHSDSQTVSGRARELHEKGYYFLRYHPKGAKPSDVWDILPEDTQKRKLHFAAYPEDLCKIPLLATCPPNGIVLDPFCGTGTTMLAAMRLGRKSIGIDIAEEYLELAAERCGVT